MTDTTRAAEQVTGPGGECIRCHEDVAVRMMVGIAETGSGPSRSIDACIPCARVYARSQFAPSWLREDLAVYDAAHRGAAE